MNEADIRKYAALMKELELTGLELTEGDKIVRLERNISANVIYSDDNTKNLWIIMHITVERAMKAVRCRI